MKRRLLSLLLCGIMLFSLCAPSVSAEGQIQDGGQATEADGLGGDHAEDGPDIGHAEGDSGTPCTHEHTGDCYTSVTKCVHVHDETCRPKNGEAEEKASGDEVSEGNAVQAGGEAGETEGCPHVCSGESGCITEELSCRHEHDGECGYSPAMEGNDYGFVGNGCPAPGNGPEQTEVQCICASPCTEENIDRDCPVCGAEGADLALCGGVKTMPPVAAAALSQMSEPALAASLNPIPSGGFVMTSSTIESQVGTYQAGGGSAEVAFDADSNTVTLTLDNAEIDGTIQTTGLNLNLIVKGTNRITNNSTTRQLTVEIKNGGNLSVRGEDGASLVLDSGGACLKATAKYMNRKWLYGDVSIENVNLTVQNKLDCAVSVGNNVLVSGSVIKGENIASRMIMTSKYNPAELIIQKNSRIEGTAGFGALHDFGTILIDDSVIDIALTQGISGQPVLCDTITIQNDSTVTLTAATSAGVLYGRDGITISGSKVNIISKGEKAAGIQSDKGEIVIEKGAEVKVESKSASVKAYSGGVVVSGSTLDVESKSGNGISAVDDIVIEKGATVKGSGYYPILTEGDIAVSGGSIDYSSTGDYGIWTKKGVLAISGSKDVKVSGVSGGMGSAAEVRIEDSSVEAHSTEGAAIWAGKVVSITGGSVTADSEQGDGIHADSDVVKISNAAFVESSGGSTGIYSGGKIHIADSEVKAHSQEYGAIEAYGSDDIVITVTGGSVTADSEENNAIYADGGSMALMGGCNVTVQSSPNVCPLALNGSSVPTLDDGFLAIVDPDKSGHFYGSFQS